MAAGVINTAFEEFQEPDHFSMAGGWRQTRQRLKT